MTRREHAINKLMEQHNSSPENYELYVEVGGNICISPWFDGTWGTQIGNDYRDHDTKERFNSRLEAIESLK